MNILTSNWTTRWVQPYGEGPDPMRELMTSAAAILDAQEVPQHGRMAWIDGVLYDGTDTDNIMTTEPIDLPPLPPRYGFILSTEDAADMCGCEPLAIIERMRTGELPGIKFGRSWMVPREAFIQRINEIALAESATRRAVGLTASDPIIQPAVTKRPRGRPRKQNKGESST